MMDHQEKKLKKFTLIGRWNSGKTSMLSIIFDQYFSSRGKGFSFPIDIWSNFKLLNFKGACINTGLSDFPRVLENGKILYTKEWEACLSNVEAIVFVFNAETKGLAYQEELKYYQITLSILVQFSSSASVFILISKFDTIQENEKEQVFLVQLIIIKQKKKEIVTRAEGLNIKIKEVYHTSYWDETLYHAWSQIVQQLIPNIDIIKESLKSYCQTCCCQEIVLFEKSTFLIIDYLVIGDQKCGVANTVNIIKYEQIANVIKRFRSICIMASTDIQAISLKSEKFTLHIHQFTENSFIMLVCDDPEISQATIFHNITYVYINIIKAKRIFSQSSGQDAEQLKLLIQTNN